MSDKHPDCEGCYNAACSKSFAEQVDKTKRCPTRCYLGGKEYGDLYRDDALKFNKVDQENKHE